MDLSTTNHLTESEEHHSFLRRCMSVARGYPDNPTKGAYNQLAAMLSELDSYTSRTYRRLLSIGITEEEAFDFLALEVSIAVRLEEEMEAVGHRGEDIEEGVA